ncbi:putative membrane protein, partial [Vibrio parahaemolyticus EKP-021]
AVGLSVGEILSPLVYVVINKTVGINRSRG